MPDVNENYSNWDLVTEEYISKGGVICPYCKSYNIVGGHIEIEDGQAVQEIHCEDCCKRWNDIYMLISIEES